MNRTKTIIASVIAASLVAALLSINAFASFTGTPVVTDSNLDGKDIELINYASGAGLGTSTITQRFDRETYRTCTLDINWTAGTGTVIITWAESNDTGAIDSARYKNVTNERFGAATFTASGLHSFQTAVRSVTKYAELEAAVTSASSDSELDMIVRCGW
jgi:hypothetical protein